MQKNQLRTTVQIIEGLRPEIVNQVGDIALRTTVQIIEGLRQLR